MTVSVYYRGAMNKLHQIDVPDVRHPAAAIHWVTEELKGDPFAKKPFLALVKGGKA